MLRAAVIAFALMAAPAFAEPPEEELTAAPGSIAIGMIEEAAADGVFEIVHNGQVSVRHIGSGLRCDFMRDGAGGSLLVFPGFPRGDDVGCSYEEAGNVGMTVYATRHPHPPALQRHVEIAEKQMRERGGPPRRLRTEQLAEAGLPDTLAQNYTVKMGRHLWFASIMVAQVDAWTITLRYSRPVNDPQIIRDAEATVPMLFRSTVLEILDARATQ